MTRPSRTETQAQAHERLPDAADFLLQAAVAPGPAGGAAERSQPRRRVV
jgi:hypothetical protein